MSDTLSSPALLQQALAQHEAGNLKQADLLYEKILQADPDNIGVLHNRGVLALQSNHMTKAINLFQQVIALDSQHSDGLCNLGNAYKSIGRYHDAEEAYVHALKYQPNQSGILINLCDTYRLMGRSEDAIAAGETVVKTESSAQAWCNLGLAYSTAGNKNKALSAFDNALSINPQYIDALLNIGLTYKELSNIVEAEKHYQKAMAIEPNNLTTLNNYGVLMKERGELQAAMDVFKKSIGIEPNFTAALINLADVLFELGMFKQSITYYQKALALEPKLSSAHFGLAFGLLISGEFQTGWREYQWRDLSSVMSPYRKHCASSCLWQGESLNEKTIVILSEQGFGDNIQFIRLVKLIVPRCKSLYITAPKELATLFQSIEGIAGLITSYQNIPEHDYYCPLLHLPAILDIDETYIPLDLPLFKPSEDSRHYWQTKKQQHKDLLEIFSSNRKKVGLVWAGSTKNLSNYKRSMSPVELLPLLNRGDIDFFSLQVGDTANADISNKLTDLSPYIRDYSDTAAIVEDLDLVISVCTSVAHLTGTMGKPVWIMLAHVADWRWLTNRNDSPWYPSARLFRQTSRNNWPSVIKAINQELSNI